jgi:hypothetical protein
MTEKKKKVVKKIDSDTERIAKARKRRLALAKEMEQVEDKTDNREEFRKYFLKLSKKLSLNKSLEEVIWTHLKTIEHDKKELFDKGVKHFGYKI